MAITGRIKVSGNKLPRVASQMDARINQAFDHAVETVFAVAGPLTRVDTGNLVSNKSVLSSNYSRLLTWNAFYAQFQNDGTIHMSGTHFANTGFDAASPVLVADLAKVFV